MLPILPDHRPSPAEDRSAGPRVAGIALTLAGLGGVGVATAFTLMAKSNLDTSNKPGGCVGNLCPAGSAAYDARSTAYRDGNIATGAWIGGGVIGAAGIGLLIAAGVMKKAEPVVAIDPGRGASFGLAGRF